MTRKIGIIGGGQLGLMIAEEAHRQGAAVYALDPSPDAPAFAECDGHIVAAYDDLEALEKLGDMTDVLTYEFENVPGDILRHLEGKYNIPQGIAPLSTHRTDCARRTMRNVTDFPYLNIFRFRPALPTRTAPRFHVS